MADLPHARSEVSAAVEHVFADDGPLAKALPGFEPRSGQRAMATAVAGTFDRGGVLLAEAGTGTGKTLAYLVPAILTGHRVLVSTGTKNLQEQILEKDLPLLERALDHPFTATCMKGRGNYLCLLRYQQARDSPAGRTREERVALALVEAWLPATATGDRAEIDEFPEDLPLWAELTANSEQCIGSECPHHAECFVTRMRQRALESDLVIVNHHLLCADAAVRQHAFGAVIPDCAYTIVDEAHQLEDVATNYFGLTVSNHRIEAFVRDGERTLAAAASVREATLGIYKALGDVDRTARRLFGDLQFRRPGVSQRTSGEGGLFDERLRLTGDLIDVVGDVALDVISALGAVEQAASSAPDAPDDVRTLGRRARELSGDLRFLLAAKDREYVFFLEIRGRGVFLRATPIDVSSIIRDLVVDRGKATVFTSATLAVNGSFEYTAARLGLDGPETLRVPSEFDFRRQAVLYLPRRMPDPRSREFVDAAAAEIVRLLDCTEGRAFVLFTSYAMMRAVEPRVAAGVPFPLLVQGTAPRTRLLDQFRRTPNSVLLATSSFWQGVDVVGDALSAVIIDKIPFASPGDPIVQARIEAIAERGGDPFAEFQLPVAILALLQGLGRLLRHRSDRGVLAILDPRLKTMGYGRTILSALPPAPVIHETAEVARFMER